MAARILVADDSVTIQKVVELTFSKEDFVLVQARSGEEAIRKAKEVRPDLVLLDLVMPDKNGYEVCAVLRADPGLRTVPIILLTGTFETFDKEQGTKAGANDFVTKPFESQVLISKVKQLLFSRTVDMAAAAAPAKEVRRPAPSPVPPPPPRVVPSPRPSGPLPPSGAPAPPSTGQPPVPAASAASIFNLPPPTEEMSTDRLWQALESTPVPASAGKDDLGELTLEDLTTVQALPQQATQEPAKIMSEDAEVVSPPGSLSLEELLSPVPSVLLGPEREPRPAEAPRVEPIFDLTAELEAPPLPLVEVGTGEPPSVSVEDLLGPVLAGEPPGMTVAEPVARVSEPTHLEELSGEPVFDLTAELEAPPLPLVEVGTGEPPSVSVEDLLGPTETVPPETIGGPLPELELELFSTSQAQETPALQEPSTVTAPLDLEALVDLPLERADRAAPEGPVGAAGPPAVAAVEATAGAAAPTPSEVAELPALMAAAPPPAEVAGISVAPPVVLPAEGAAPVVPAAGGPLETGGPAGDMGAMRQAVTERVAHELARDLSDKLLERIERIVWEVVPDLAEILITKEIERIRAMAEEKRTS